MLKSANVAGPCALRYRRRSSSSAFSGGKSCQSGSHFSGRTNVASPSRTGPKQAWPRMHARKMTPSSEKTVRPIRNPVAFAGLPHPRPDFWAILTPSDVLIRSAISGRVRGRSRAFRIAPTSRSTDSVGIFARVIQAIHRASRRALPRRNTAKSREGMRWSVPRMHQDFTSVRSRHNASSTSGMRRPRVRAHNAICAADSN